MTDKTLQLLINQLNKNKEYELVKLRPLSATVDYARYWDKKPAPTDNITYPDKPYDIYFIKNKQGVYVGNVLDMWNDLHWFIDPKHRKQGHLIRAMKETIIYHLFQNRDKLRVTVNKYELKKENFNSSLKVAELLGFVLKQENEYSFSEFTLDKSKYSTKKRINGINTKISEERLEILKKQINFCSLYLSFINSEIEMSLGNIEYSETLEKLANEIKSHTWKIEDAWWKNKT